MSNAVQDLENLLHHDIPLTRSLGLRVMAWQDSQLRLHLPLQENLNHKSTMFGGSLYCGAVLAGWGWLHLRLRESGITDGHIVIQESQIAYPLPVTQDALVLCDAPSEQIWQRFLATYRKHGRARLSLSSSIHNTANAPEAVRFTGQFVLHR